MPARRPPLPASPSGPHDGPASGTHGLYVSRLRVRYPETDPQGVAHHAVYLHYFEFGRTEMLRELGLPYAVLEREGTRLMVTEASVRYLAPAGYDDELRIETRVDRLARVRIYLSYEVFREATGERTCTGATTLASVDERGRPCPLPEAFVRAVRRD